MKTKLFTLLFTIMVSTSALAAQKFYLAIDGNFDDWKTIPANLLAEASVNANAEYTNLKNIKFCADNDYIYFYVESDSDGPIDIYMNVDGNQTTGGNSWCWSNSAADYLIEGFLSENLSDARLFSFPETASQDSSWAFEYTGIIGFITACDYKNATIEGRIPRSKIPNPITSLQVGVMTSTRAWETSGCLPQMDKDGSTRPLLEVPIYDGLFPEFPSEGVCGDNLTWALADDSTLTISGTGTMADYNFSIGCPWSGSKSKIKSIIVENSVTSIGSYAFSNCGNLTSVTIGNSVANIGKYAFDGCSKLKEVHISDIAAWCNISFDYFQSNPLYYAGHLFLNDEEIYNLTIPNSVTRIGDYAFVNCGNIETLSLGKSLETIGIYSFNNFQRLIDIYCYAERVPTVNASAFNGVSRKAYVWVPASRLRNYQTHEVWGEFDVKAMAAEGVNASSVTIVPDYNTASVIWPAVENADTYELAITNKDGKTICTLVFNGDGILQSIAFSAPSRNNSSEQTQSTGFRFEVSGLEEGTSYNYSIVAKDVTSKALQTFNGSFKTLGGVDALTDISTDKTSLRKEMINGQLFILRGDKTYTVQGQQIR